MQFLFSFSGLKRDNFRFRGGDLRRYRLFYALFSDRFFAGGVGGGVLARRNARFEFEHFAEIVQRAVTGGFGDFTYRRAVADKKFGGFFDADGAQVFYGRNVENLGENLAEVYGADACDSGKSIVGDVGIAVVGVDIVDDRFEHMFVTVGKVRLLFVRGSFV